MVVGRRRSGIGGRVLALLTAAGRLAGQSAVGSVVAVCCLVSAAGASATPVFRQASGSPFSSGAGVFTVAFSPSGGLLAAANFGANTVSVFTVNQTTGGLTLSGSPYSVGSGPESAIFSPSGGLLAVGNTNSNSVSMFAVDQATGALTEVSGSPFSTGADPGVVAFSPGGSLLAVPDFGDGTVSMFTVNQTTGALTQVSGSPFTAGTGPAAVAFSPDGKLLATANELSGSVSMYSVNQTTGALTQLSGSPYAVGKFPTSIQFSPGGGELATANSGDNTFSEFTVASGGALTPVSGSPFATGGDPFGVAFSPDGVLLATANGADSVSVFSLSAAGVPTQVSGSPFGTGLNTGPSWVAFNPDGWMLATANNVTGTVSVFTVQPPSASISSPVDAQVYAVNRSVATSFSCGEATYGPGISACQDSNGSDSPGALQTSTVGQFTYTVTATSKDGQTGTAQISYTVAAAPSARITSPANNQTYAVGQAVATAFTCSEGTDGPGIQSCTDSASSSSPATLDTSTLGQHTYTVTATSKDGQTGTAQISYTVAAAPSARITSPANNQTYAVGQAVATAFTCSEGTDGPGIQSCTDSASSSSPATLDTSTLGQHTYTVTATSKDGQTGTAQISYTVAAAPSARITSPANNQTYAVGQAVATAFTCSEGTDGPGIQSCTDSASSSSPATLDTSTLGQHTYTVTATSKDGQTGTAQISYTVAAAPSARITSPANNQTYAVGQAVATAFTCSEGTDGPGIQSCTDSTGSSSPGVLDTSTAGTHTYTVTATSNDGQSGTASITYAITAAPPATQPTPAQPTPAAPITTNPPPTTAAPTATPPVAISAVKLTKATITWCKHCTYPNTRLHFTLTAGTDVRLTLMAKLDGHWKQLATSMLHGHKGPNSIRVAGRWHGQLVPHRTIRILLRIHKNGTWTLVKTFTLVVNSPYTTKILNRH